MIEGIDDLIKNGWKKSTDGNAITKTFIFTNFIEALGWMVKVGVWAEKLNHHPEWDNVYKTVTFCLPLTTKERSQIRRYFGSKNGQYL